MLRLDETLAQMSTLREELEEWEWDEIAALLDQPEERANEQLAAMWVDRLDTRDTAQILGFARLWSPIEVVATASCRCARLVVERTSRRAGKDAIAAIETTERWARGETTLEDVWEAGQRASGAAFEGDAVAEIAADVAGSAGQNQAGFDDEALDAADRSVTAVIGILGEPGLVKVMEILRDAFAAPSVARLREAHAVRWRDA